MRAPRTRTVFHFALPFAALCASLAAPARAEPPQDAAPTGELQLIFEDDFETGDDSIWPLAYPIRLPFGTLDKALAVIFTPVDPRLDVAFSVDTTGSMGGEISNLQTGLTSIAPSFAAMIPDSAMAAAAWQDFPLAPFGDPPGSPGNADGDFPWQLLAPMTTTVSTIQTAFNSMTAVGGSDLAEAGFEAFYQLATGAGVSWTGGSVPPYGGAGSGGVGFRDGTLPFAVHVTDAPAHTVAEYGATVPAAHSQAQAEAALNALGVRVISILTETNATANTQLQAVAVNTGAEVAPCAFPPVAGCAPTQCCTGLNGAGETPAVNGLCPLRFRVANNGAGLSTAVLSGVRTAIKFGKHEVVSAAADEDSDPPDTTCFVDRLVADAFISPPQEPERSCAPVATPVDLGGGGYPDGFAGLVTASTAGTPGSQLRFVVHAKNPCVASISTAQVLPVALTLTDTLTGELMDVLTLHVIVPATP